MTKKEKCSNTQKNRKVIHLGDNELRIYENQLEEYLNNGWQLGQSDKHKESSSKSHAGKATYIRTKPMSQEQRNKISKTLKQGYKSGKIVQNHSQESIERQHAHWKVTCEAKGAYSMTGKHQSDYQKQKAAEARHKSKGYHLTKETLEIKLEKEYITKKQNNSFNSSSIEDQFYEQLLKDNETKTIFRRYKDKERYPFYCDFYILEDDLFIELNAHWTHGGKPYDPNDEFCQKQLNEWQEKAKQSKFYQNAIETWTIRDVKKAQVAKEHNLNYKVIY